jgi:hypothetical protein
MVKESVWAEQLVDVAVVVQVVVDVVAMGSGNDDGSGGGGGGGDGGGSGGDSGGGWHRYSWCKRTSRMPNRAEQQSNINKRFIIIIMTYLVCSPRSRGERG